MIYCQGDKIITFVQNTHLDKIFELRLTNETMKKEKERHTGQK